MLKTFKGFKGKVVFGQIDNCKFVIMAERPAQLEALWSSIMAEVPFNPNGISNAILIEANTLPDRRLPLTPGFSQVDTAPSEPTTVSTVSPTIEV